MNTNTNTMRSFAAAVLAATGGVTAASTMAAEPASATPTRVIRVAAAPAKGIWYVDNTLPSDGDGSESNPFRALATALNTAKDGDEALAVRHVQAGGRLVKHIGNAG